MMPQIIDGGSTVRLLLALLAFSQVTTEPAKNSGDQPAFGVSGVDAKDVPNVIDQKQFRLPAKDGVLVVSVFNYYPAKAAGLRPLDIITSFAGKPVKSSSDLQTLISGMKVGQKYRLTVRRSSRDSTGRTRWQTGTLTLRPVTRKEACLAAVGGEKDEFRGFEIVRHRDSPDHVYDRSDVSLYFPRKDGKPQALRLKIQYVSDNWLFVEKYSFRANQKTLDIEPVQFKIERDHGIIAGANRVWEWYDAEVPNQQIQFWDEISKAPKLTMRYEGKQYVHDRDLDFEERDRLGIVLEAYRYLGGE
jgi:hypothetical protein